MGQSFISVLKGRLFGVMNEEEYVNMAQSLPGDQTWYGLLFSPEVKGKSPVSPVAISGGEVGKKLLELYEEVKKRKSISGKFPHTYVNDRNAPGLIKLYDPGKCGGSCSTTAPDPWWIFSTLKPETSELSQVFAKKK